MITIKIDLHIRRIEETMSSPKEDAWTVQHNRNKKLERSSFCGCFANKKQGAPVDGKTLVFDDDESVKAGGNKTDS